MLALGEYDPRTAAAQMELLNAFVKDRGDIVGVKYRPHPGILHHAIGLDSRIELSTSKSIREDLADSDIALSSSVSTASLDALLAGVPTIVYRDGTVLDGQLIPIGAGTVSVASASELIAAIDGLLESGVPPSIAPLEVFNLDGELPKWIKFLTEFC